MPCLSKIHLKKGMTHKAVEWISWQNWKNVKTLTVCWRESARRVQLSGNQAAVNHVWWQHWEGAQSGRQAKMQQSACKISCETCIPRLSVHRIIHCDLQLWCFKRCHTQLLSEANHVTRVICW